jgi:hypothetical protein
MENEVLASWTKGYDAGNTGMMKAIETNVMLERKKVIDLLLELNVIRRDALGHLVAFNTDGTEVVYLTGLENK